MYIEENNFSELDPHTLGMARPGELVSFLDANGYQAERDHARSYFTKGQELTVERISIGGFSSSYTFKEEKGRWFNTVMFEPMGGTKEHLVDPPQSETITQ